MARVDLPCMLSARGQISRLCLITGQGLCCNRRGAGGRFCRLGMEPAILILELRDEFERGMPVPPYYRTRLVQPCQVHSEMSEMTMTQLETIRSLVSERVRTLSSWSAT